MSLLKNLRLRLLKNLREIAEESLSENTVKEATDADVGIETRELVAESLIYTETPQDDFRHYMQCAYGVSRSVYLDVF